MNNLYTIRFVESDSETHASEVRIAWETLLQNSSNFDRLFQSPAWFDHLRATKPDTRMVLAIVERSGDGIVGVVPLSIANRTLDYTIYGRVLWRHKIQIAGLLGNQPLLPCDDHVYATLFSRFRIVYPECQGFYFNAIPVEGALWALLQRLGSFTTRHRMLLCRTDDVRRHHLIRLPATLADYLDHFQGRTRKGLRRHLRQFERQPEGLSPLLRVESPEQVESFVKAAAAISKKSWQYERLGSRVEFSPDQCRELTDLAERGVLRAYLLVHQGIPCAFSIGLQYRDVFHDFEVGYDRDFSDFSPGTVLFLLMIEDLVRHRPTVYYNFGVGDAPYKGQLGTEWYPDTSLLLLSATPGNRVRIAAHGAFRRCLSWLGWCRRVYRRVLTSGSAEDAS